MTAPARIRLHPLDWKTSKGTVTTWHQTLGEGVEYVRADLMDAEIEKYRVAIEHTGRVVSDMLGKCPQEAVETAETAEAGSRVSGGPETPEPASGALNGVDMLAIYGSPTGPDPWPMRDSGVE